MADRSVEGGELPPGVDLAPLLDAVFDVEGPLAKTFAVIVVQGGRVVAERYQGALEHSTASPRRHRRHTATQLVDGQVDAARRRRPVGRRRAPRPRHAGRRARVVGPGDPRHAITLRQLLAMRDGLAFVEDYVDDRISDVIHMLFGEGQPDMAHFAADRPLAAPPGTRFNYSSGTSNIISGVVARTVGPAESYARFLHGRLFGPIGMRSADPEFDEAGTWVASSYVHATAQRLARFGLLYLRDGMWDGVRILPPGWVDYGRTWVSVDPDDDSPYGAHWWAWWATPRHLPRLRLRGAVDHALPPPRPHGGASGQDTARARGQPRAVAQGHGAGLRRRPLSPLAGQARFGRRRRRGSAGPSSPGTRRRADRRRRRAPTRSAFSSPCTSRTVTANGSGPS